MSVDDHRHLMTGEGPASCTGCDWKSRQIGISSMTQQEEHRKRLAALAALAADQPTTEPSEGEPLGVVVMTGNPPVDLVACRLCGVLLWDEVGHHGLGPAHPWEPDRYCPPEPVEPAPDVERDERLREARTDAAYLRRRPGGALAMGLGNRGGPHVVALDDEVTRLDAVVTAVREAHQPEMWEDDLEGTSGVACSTCVDANGESITYPCPTVRALDGGAA